MRRCRAPAGRRRWRPRRRTSGRRCPGIRRSAWGYVSSWSPSPVLAVRAYDEVAMSASANTIDTLLEERRSVPPSDEFRRRARVTDDSLHRAAAADPEAFWAEQALRYITWFQPWERVLDWELPFARWFVGGKLNVAFNCLDRHVDAGRGDKVAYHWEGEPGDTRTITYAELLAEVCKFANALRALGVRRGDRVGIYLPMIPELPVAMLACARIGAPHSVVFGGFSAEAVRDRMDDAEATVLITADEGWRRGGRVALKRNSDDALTQCR